MLLVFHIGVFGQYFPTFSVYILLKIGYVSDLGKLGFTTENCHFGVKIYNICSFFLRISKGGIHASSPLYSLFYVKVSVVTG